MQKYHILCIFLLLFSCAPPKPKPPGDMLNKDQMSTIISELHIADALAMQKGIGNKDSINQYKVTYRDWVFQKYGVSGEQFQTSFDFYAANPVLLDSVYADVVTKLSAKESEYAGK